MKKGFAFLLSVILFALVGCGGKVSLVGKVTYSDDDSPLTTGVVCFESDTHTSLGTLQSDGTFRVGSLSEKDGIPPGTYRVYVSGALREIGVDRYGELLHESLIDDKFTSGLTSGLTVSVPAPSGKYDFQVDRYVPTTEMRQRRW